jgi:hypothetical protein
MAVNRLDKNQVWKSCQAVARSALDKKSSCEKSKAQEPLGVWRSKNQDPG